MQGCPMQAPCTAHALKAHAIHKAITITMPHHYRGSCSKSNHAAGRYRLHECFCTGTSEHTHITTPNPRETALRIRHFHMVPPGQEAQTLLAVQTPGLQARFENGTQLEVYPACASILHAPSSNRSIRGHSVVHAKPRVSQWPLA